MSDTGHIYADVSFRKGTASQLTPAEHLGGFEAEPLYITDTHQFYIHDGNSYKVVPTAQEMITNNDEVVVHNDEVIYLGG